MDYQETQMYGDVMAMFKKTWGDFTLGSSGRRIEFLTQLVSPVIHVATSLNRQPIIYLKVCRKGKDNARTRFFTLYTVHYPI
jgi:hypothetical protein